jgi:hypothetical protein
MARVPAGTERIRSQIDSGYDKGAFDHVLTQINTNSGRVQH